MTTNDVQKKIREVTYCSFADETGCKGVVVLVGTYQGIKVAIESSRLGLNPGGEIMYASISETDNDVSLAQFEILWANAGRLIQEQEARELFDARHGSEWEEESDNACRVHS
jgi:hypothetical protein